MMTAEKSNDDAPTAPEDVEEDDEHTGAPDGGGMLAKSGRVEAFSDGVLAIAITLLVLDLKVPEGEPGTIARGLLDQWTSYIAYLASFVYVGVIWVNHHALFQRVPRVDSGVLWWNLVLLLPVTILPFPTAALAYAMQHGSRSDQFVCITLYGLVSASMGGTWLFMFAHLDRHPYLLRKDVPRGFFREEHRRAAFGIISPFIAIAIGLVSPPLALLAFLALPLFYGFNSEGLPRAAAR